MGLSTPTLDLIDSLGSAPIIENTDDTVDVIHDGFKSEIVVKNVTLTYPGKQTPAVLDVSMTIPAGTSIAFV